MENKKKEKKRVRKSWEQKHIFPALSFQRFPYTFPRVFFPRVNSLIFHRTNLWIWRSLKLTLLCVLVSVKVLKIDTKESTKYSTTVAVLSVEDCGVCQDEGKYGWIKQQQQTIRRFIDSTPRFCLIFKHSTLLPLFSYFRKSSRMVADTNEKSKATLKSFLLCWWLEWECAGVLDKL